MLSEQTKSSGSLGEAVDIYVIQVDIRTSLERMARGTAATRTATIMQLWNDGGLLRTASRPSPYMRMCRHRCVVTKNQ